MARRQESDGKERLTRGLEGKERALRFEEVLYTQRRHEISHRRFKHDGSIFRRVRKWRKRRKRPSQGTEGHSEGTRDWKRL